MSEAAGTMLVRLYKCTASRTPRHQHVFLRTTVLVIAERLGRT